MQILSSFILFLYTEGKHKGKRQANAAGLDLRLQQGTKSTYTLVYNSREGISISMSKKGRDRYVTLGYEVL